MAKKESTQKEVINIPFFKSSRDQDSISTINNLFVENFFSIKNIKLKNLKNKKEIYIVGENGDGKTLLLQALTISIVGVKEGVVFDLFKSHFITFCPEKFNSDRNENINLLAYGSSRNSVCKMKEDKVGYLTLFSGEYDLKNPIEWLIELYNAKNDEVKLVISLHEAIELLQRLLNRDIKISVNYKSVIFEEKDAEVSFEQLSAGYKGVITIICDLIARLSEKQQVENIAELQGIVLIDEVELHLHPKWQYAFMNKLRETFPLIQFIVTTHSSTVLLGASMDAVYYHIYKENGETKISEQQEVKNDFLNDIQTNIFNFDVNEERIYNPTSDNKRRQKRAKESLLNLIDTIEKEERQ